MSADGIEAAFAGRLGTFTLDVALSAPARGVTVLFGPSGCGKTTVLRCLAGLTRLGGRLSVAGEVWQDAARFTPTHRRPIGYVFQEPSLFGHLSVQRNLAFGLRRAHGARHIGFDEVAALLGLETLLGRHTAKLSGGERQRVAIGRALLSQPKLLLMDEPLASLDAARKAEVLPYLERLHDQLAIPIVYVTHDLGEALRLGDRLVLMDAGRVSRIHELDGRMRVDAQASIAERLQAQLAHGVDDVVVRLALAALAAGLAPEVNP